MEVARLTSKGQITIPKAVRERLSLAEGDKVAFIEKDGNIVITKSSISALSKFLDSMAKEVRERGVSEEDLWKDLEEKMSNERNK